MEPIRIVRGELDPDDFDNPRDYIFHPDNPSQVDMAVEKLIRESAPNGFVFKGVSKVKGSYKDFQIGLLVRRDEFYELKEEGAVRYGRYVLIGSYAAEVELMGFREDSECFQKLKAGLEELASKNPANPTE